MTSFSLHRCFLAAALGLLGLAVTAPAPALAQAPGSQPPPAGAPAPAPAPAAPATPVTDDDIDEDFGVPAGVIEDANSGRQFAAPTALTAPAGTWALNSYEVVFLGLSYSFTDRFSVSLTTLPPITTDVPLILLGSAKLKLVETDSWHFAATASVAHVEEVTGALFGGALTGCLDDECHSTFNAYSAAGIALDPDADQSTVPFVVSLGLAHRLSERAKLLLEGDFGFAVGEVDDVTNGFLFWYGARFTSRNLGVDLGFARPLCFDGEDCDVGLALGIPWVAFTYRPID